jgi:alpha-2-macroglobulin
LTDYLSISGELQGAFEWQLGLNGQTRRKGRVDPATVATDPTQAVLPMPLLRIGSNLVELIRSVGPGRLYYSLQLRSFALSDDIQFVAQGITVGREYLRLGPGESTTKQPVSELHVGDVVQVRLTVMAPASLQAVVLEDPLPAGLEPVDTQLKTTSQAIASAVGTVKTRGWQPWTHLDVRADHVAVFANYLERGAFQYTYVARAALPGEYRVLPVNAHEQYFPEVFGHGDGQHLTIYP